MRETLGTWSCTLPKKIAPTETFLHAATLIRDQGGYQEDPPATPSYSVEGVGWARGRRIQEVRRLNQSFDHARHEQRVPSELLDTIYALWGRIDGRVPGLLSAPYLTITESGQPALYWDDTKNHAEVERTEDGTLEYFTLVYETRQTWSAEAVGDMPPPEDFLRFLNAFRILT